MSTAADRARRYHAAIRRVLLKEWDPIGVENEPAAQDEYDSYVGPVYRMLIERRPLHEIFDFLWQTETEHMGLSGNRQVTEAVARRLMQIPDEIDTPEN